MQIQAVQQHSLNMQVYYIQLYQAFLHIHSQQHYIPLTADLYISAQVKEHQEYHDS